MSGVSGLFPRGLLPAALAVVVLCPLPALAYRPFDGTDAAVAAKGEVELELGPVGFEKDGPSRTLVAPSAVLNLGVTGRAELVLEGRQVIQLGDRIDGPRSRVDDVALSFKTVLREGSLQEQAGVSVASELSALLPATDGGVGAELAVIASRRWPELTVHLNGAATWTRAHRPGLAGGAIFEVHDAWALRPVAEVRVQGERDEPTVVSGLAGAIWRLRDGVSLDAGLRVAREGGVSATELRAGLTWGFDAGLGRSPDVGRAQSK
ncbi:hypothetical protein [Anaeromyxobacter paludicola]|uniref:Uncharacterized protein n=1 Tax=Anaeromyxobacter paludicola TaxID=2918171 RepID=A0ABN6NE60_9BACT|nr:hypothetical protein [Anaeromyxobacter paludicola]BDG10765.1 hypothetical protein AMPC_38780 [Anaeromyxobacter paludicola]